MTGLYQGGITLELIKKNIHMNRLKCKSNLQLTLGDDFNVPDTKPDIVKAIKVKGDIKVEEQKVLNGKLYIKGAMQFQILYISDEPAKPIHSMQGQLAFDEVIHMDPSCNQDDVSVRYELEDISCSIINSRKLSLKSLLHLYAQAEEVHDEEGAIEVIGEDSVQTICKEISVTGISVSKKDAYRFRDEIILPSGKGTISEILYKEVELKNTEIRLLEDKFTVKGEIAVFFIYTGTEEGIPFEYYETELPFSSTIDCNGCNEDMTPNINVTLGSTNLEVKPDSDGEERLIECEAVLDMNIKIYEDSRFEIIKDLYSPTKKLTPQFKVTTYENLLVKNINKSKVTDRIRVASDDPRVLQVCHATGVVKVDEVFPSEHGLTVNGVVEASVFYITPEDNRPLHSIKTSIPFSQVIEAGELSGDHVFEVTPSLEQINVMMMDTEEMEVKAVLVLNAIVFEIKEEPLIVDVTTEDLDFGKIESMPGLIGYIVKPGDTLWNIAKKYYTTVDAIKELNELDSDMIYPGDQLLILKETAMFLH